MNVLLKHDSTYYLYTSIVQLHRVMAQWGSYLLLLVLLVPVISRFESAEYYIRPTALTTNTSCPGQPCLTLNHYMNNTSHYIQSNTVFNFLPGKHVLKRPLHINNVQNVTLKSSTAGSGMHSQLLVKFLCENESLNHCIYTQSAIEMINVTNVVINNISLEMWTPNVSGVIVERSTDVHLQLHIHSVQGNDSLAAGVTVNEASHLYMDGLQVGNLYNGIRIENTNKVSIINSSFDNCQNSGMVIINSDAIDISNTTLSNNMENGMYLESCNNTTLTSISATNNQQDGMNLISCSNASLKDISVTNNTQCGMNISLCVNIDLKNIYATGLAIYVRMTMMYVENNHGIYFESCENTTMMNISAINNQGDGMYFVLCENTTMMNISAINNQGDGIFFDACENTTMTNISAINNRFIGMLFFSCKNTTMMNISAINNQGDGMVFSPCEKTTMTNISAINNQFIGMLFFSCKNTTMMNISAINNQRQGMYFNSCENTTMMNISAINNTEDGIEFNSCENTTMINISAINQFIGMFFFSCKNTIMMNISAINNTDDGMYFESCENTTMMNISAINNTDGGMYFDSCENTTMMNISAINNQFIGMFFFSCKNTTMMNISAINNIGEGIFKRNCTNTILTDINAAYNQYGGIVIENPFQNIVLRNISVNHNGDNQIIFSSSYNIQLEYSTFSDIITLPTLNTATNPRTVPAVIELNDCTLIMSNCTFTRNNITSIRAIGSKIIAEGEIIFSDNRALSGAALLFVSSSALVISETSTVRFQNNYALNYGGAIYILTDEYYKRTFFFRDVSSASILPERVTPTVVFYLLKVIDHRQGSSLQTTQQTKVEMLSMED